MPIGKASDFKIYQEEYFGGMYESISQNTNVFNGASAGTITLVGRDHKGDYKKESFIKDIAGLISRRDTTSVAAADDTAVSQGEIVSVKIGRKIGPIAQTLDAWRKISSDPREMSFLIGQMVGEKKVQDYLNTALLAAVPAIGAIANLTHDYSATGTINHAQIVTGLSKFGDQASRIKAFIMHSKTYFNLMNAALADKIVEVAGVVIYQGSVATFNRPVIVTDSFALLDTVPATDVYFTLGLVDRAITVEESEAEEIESQIVTGLENLVFRIQGEHSFTLGVRGFSWDTTTGGANPTDAAVATAANWDKVATADKDCAGILIKTQ
jgi:hypothetical protein